MAVIEKRRHFEAHKKIYESAKLTFHGVNGFDVYNTSIPFEWKGTTYIYGRVEKRKDWARSWVKLFKKTGEDEWTLVPDSMVYPLEDPFVSFIGEELILGGTHVTYRNSIADSFCAYFYRGTDIHDLHYFETGPDNMKDIRLVALPDKKIGVFSRPRGDEIIARHGSESMIGFTVINHIGELSSDVIEKAPYIPDLFDCDEWGGCNQAYYLDSGNIGIIGHKCYKYTRADTQSVEVYLNVAYVFNPDTHRMISEKIIGSRSCYPEGPAKTPRLIDCAFTSGIITKGTNNRVDLYSGIGDCEEGRIVIDYPFEGFGRIIAF